MKQTTLEIQHIALTELMRAKTDPMNTLVIQIALSLQTAQLLQMEKIAQLGQNAYGLQTFYHMKTSQFRHIALKILLQTFFSKIQLGKDALLLQTFRKKLFAKKHILKLQNAWLIQNVRLALAES
jgi:hypothetical protein